MLLAVFVCFYLPHVFPTSLLTPTPFTLTKDQGQPVGFRNPHYTNVNYENADFQVNSPEGHTAANQRVFKCYLDSCLSLGLEVHEQTPIAFP